MKLSPQESDAWSAGYHFGRSTAADFYNGSISDWQSRQLAAQGSPVGTEVPFVQLLAAIDTLVRRHADDYVLRDGIAHLIMGMNDLLNADTGRLDCGSLSDLMNHYAEAISFDLAVERFTDGTD